MTDIKEISNDKQEAFLSKWVSGEGIALISVRYELLNITIKKDLNNYYENFR